jgi:hypothetical protein
MRHLVLVLLASPACIIPVAQPSPSNGGTYSGGGGGTGAPAPEPTYESTAPASPSVVSVTIRSSCSQTVRVFYGEKPKWGSGTYSTISSNSSTSHSFRPGDMFWIVDDSENGLSSTSVGVGTRQIEILPSCTGFRVE